MLIRILVLMYSERGSDSGVGEDIFSSGAVVCGGGVGDEVLCCAKNQQ